MSHRNFLFTAIFVFRIACLWHLCQRCDSCVFESRYWIMASKEAEKTSWRKFLVNATDGERAIVVKITNKQQQEYFFREKGLGRSTWPRNLSTQNAFTQNGGQNSISHVHFSILYHWFYIQYFPVWENCILESIEETLAKKAETAESCVETNDEDDNYDDNDLSSDNLSGVVETSRRSQRRQPAWQQLRRWAREQFHFLHSFVNKVIINH